MMKSCWRKKQNHETRREGCQKAAFKKYPGSLPNWGHRSVSPSDLVPPQAMLPGLLIPNRQNQREGGIALREPISLGLNLEEVPMNQRWSPTFVENKSLSADGKFGKQRESLSTSSYFFFSPRVKILPHTYRILGTGWSHNEQKARCSDKCASFWQCHWLRFILPHSNDL